MRHEHDSRIYQLKGFIEDEKRTLGKEAAPSPELRAMRKERLRLITERWEDLVATFGDPRRPGWPKRPLHWRGQPVAVDRLEIKEMLKLASMQ